MPLPAHEPPEHPLLAALRMGTVEDLRTALLGYPDWPVSVAPHDCPMARLLMFYGNPRDPREKALRVALANELLGSLAPGALRDKPNLLVTVARDGLVEMVPLLLPFVDPNGVHEGFTPLSAAAEESHLDVVRALAPSCDPNASNQVGETALMRLAQQNQAQGLRAVLDLPGLDLERVDHQGRTALTHAAISGHWEATRRLLHRGANLNHQDHQGRTPLMHAADEGWASLVSQVLSYKPARANHPRLNLLLVDAQGETPESLLRHLQASDPFLTEQTLRERILARRAQQETAQLRTALHEVSIAPAPTSVRAGREVEAPATSGAHRPGPRTRARL